MGTLVGFSSLHPLPASALARAVASLHDADRIFSTWSDTSPLSRLRRGEVPLPELSDATDIYEVLERCAVARRLSRGWFDPWKMPGGLDPTGLVKGWAAQRSRDILTEMGVTDVMVNAGGDIAVSGAWHGAPWRIGIRHPRKPDSLAAVVDVCAAVATSGEYERPGQLVAPSTGAVANDVLSATVVGAQLDIADALATALAVAGPSLLPDIEDAGYNALVLTSAGRAYATPDMPFARDRVLPAA
jgi:FAD:protein FMN transferase